MIRRVGYRIGAAGLALVLLAGCATTQAGPADAAAAGGILGAATGAAVGGLASGRHSGRNALLGAVIGGLAGALIGGAVAVAQQSPPPPGPPAGVPPPPPPPGGQWTVVTQPPPPGAPPGPVPDPTRGVLTNGTAWEIHVFIDQPPGSPGPLVLRPGNAIPVNLDIGQHRIVAQAFVDTQFGRRVVGTFDRTLTVDPRAPGWTIHFFPASF